MTERAETIAQAQAAQAAGEAVSASIANHGEEMLDLPGGGVDVSDANRSPDDGAVAGIGTSSQPPAVSPQPSRAPNVVDPLDNSQSQG
jgi:hypothetical protein